jgi:8-oxo-dGTP diphosphatase
MQRVAVGIILKDGLVLACQRRQGSRYSLKWEFPGGKLNHKESPSEALARELREELAIDAVIGREFLQQEWAYPGNPADRHQESAFHITYYLVGSFTGRPVNKAFEQIAWVSPSVLKTMDILEGNRVAIDMLVKHIQQPPEARQP